MDEEIDPKILPSFMFVQFESCWFGILHVASLLSHSFSLMDVYWVTFIFQFAFVPFCSYMFSTVMSQISMFLCFHAYFAMGWFPVLERKTFRNPARKTFLWYPCSIGKASADRMRILNDALLQRFRTKILWSSSPEGSAVLFQMITNKNTKMYGV